MRAVAAFAVVVLIAITAFCPAWSCAELAARSHSCCPGPNHTQHRPPCDTTIQTCPYLLLEKTKTIVLHFAPPPQTAALVLAIWCHEEAGAFNTSYFPNAADSFLRNRVLLI